MITRVSFTDSEQGEFVYERDEEDPFKWHARVPHTDGSLSRRLDTPVDGRDVIWQIAIAALQEVET